VENNEKSLGSKNHEHVDVKTSVNKELKSLGSKNPNHADVGLSVSKTRKNAIVEYLDYQLMRPKGNGDKQAAKRDLSVMRVRVGVANFFFKQSIGIVHDCKSIFRKYR